MGSSCVAAAQLGWETDVRGQPGTLVEGARVRVTLVDQGSGPVRAVWDDHHRAARGSFDQRSSRATPLCAPSPRTPVRIASSARIEWHGVSRRLGSPCSARCCSLSSAAVHLPHFSEANRAKIKGGNLAQLLEWG